MMAATVVTAAGASSYELLTKASTIRPTPTSTVPLLCRLRLRTCRASCTPQRYASTAPARNASTDLAIELIGQLQRAPARRHGHGGGQDPHHGRALTITVLSRGIGRR